MVMAIGIVSFAVAHVATFRLKHSGGGWKVLSRRGWRRRHRKLSLAGPAMTDPALPSALYGPRFASAPMRAILADAARLQRMLDVEAALARAEAAAGVIPDVAVAPIVTACRAERFDMTALAEAAVTAGNLAIPLVKALTAAVKSSDPDAARFVHWSATSPDIIDTAQVLELAAVIDALLADLDRAIAGFAGLAERHRATAVAGRTWLQHALPIPFGLKLAGYAAALARSRTRLRRLKAENLVLQFGGAAGTRPLATPPSRSPKSSPPT
jgi:3-carboxy-cis,cis-muconate cycloisomerase